MEQEKYNKLLEDVKYKVMDLVDKITDDYVEGFVETVDCEIANIKENRDFYQKQSYKYETALKFACEKILKLQGHSPAEIDFIDRRVELENEFLEQREI